MTNIFSKELKAWNEECSMVARAALRWNTPETVTAEIIHRAAQIHVRERCAKYLAKDPDRVGLTEARQFKTIEGLAYGATMLIRAFQAVDMNEQWPPNA